MLREYLFVPGMGETTARAFRDKLAMRGRARSAGIRCPDFVHVLNHEAHPRVDGAGAAAVGAEAAIAGGGGRHQEAARRPTSSGSAIEALGDGHADYLLEQFVPGDVYHVDSIVFDRQPVFAMVSRYATPPMAVAHEGGIFVTRTLPDDDPASSALREMNAGS